jgi:hypothetical protein
MSVFVLPVRNEDFRSTEHHGGVWGGSEGIRNKGEIYQARCLTGATTEFTLPPVRDGAPQIYGDGEIEGRQLYQLSAPIKALRPFGLPYVQCTVRLPSPIITRVVILIVFTRKCRVRFRHFRPNTGYFRNFRPNTGYFRPTIWPSAVSVV